MVMRLFLTLMLPFWVQLCHSVTVGVDQASCVAAGRFRPLNSAWLETKLIAEAAASKTAAVAAAGVADKVANGIEVDDELFRVYMIMGTFFGGPLPQPSVQAIANQYNTFLHNLNTIPNTIQLWCGDGFIQWRQIGVNNGQPVFWWVDTDKHPPVVMAHNFRNCASSPNTNAYAFNGGTDVVICDRAWNRRKDNQYLITGYQRNPQSIINSESLDVYSLITGTLSHELYHTFLGSHQDHQVIINGQAVRAYGTYNCMQLSLQNPAATTSNCESIMLASIAMYLEGKHWWRGYAEAL